MNPILILTRNCLALTKRCVESVRAQDIQTTVDIFDNGSSDGTLNWASEQGILLHAESENIGVSAGWNYGLTYNFFRGAEHVLVIGNDTVLPPWMYRELLSYDLPFITGVAVDNMPQVICPTEKIPVTPNPDFSCYLIRKEAWDKVGPFDQRMKLYSSDQDYHIRAHRDGIHLAKAVVPFYHERSSTLRLASSQEREAIETQANLDRAFLRKKWGVSAGGSDYEALFTPELFGCERTRSSRSDPAPAEHDSTDGTGT